MCEAFSCIIFVWSRGTNDTSSHKVRHYKGHLFEGLWKRGEYVHHIIHPLVVKRGNEKSPYQWGK